MISHFFNATFLIRLILQTKKVHLEEHWLYSLNKTEALPVMKGEEKPRVSLVSY